MLALRKTRPGFGAELQDIPAPAETPGAGEVLIDVAAAGICGSDLHAFEWSPGYEFMTPLMPVTIGHEFAGVVSRTGPGVTVPAVGDRVSCWPTLPCGDCPGCRSGRPLECEGRRIIGLHVDGAFAPSVKVPAGNCRVLPDSLPLETAALTEPLSIAVNAVDLAEIAPGAATVVLGPGPIGMAAAWVARHRGAKVLLAGLSDAARLAHARTMGIEDTADLAEETLEQAAARCFGRRVDRMIEATGAARSVEEGLALLRPRGIFVVAGIHSEPCSLDLTRFVREKKQLRGAHDTTGEALDEAVRLLDAHGAELSRLITHQEPLSRALQAMTLARGKMAVKVLLVPDAEGNEAKND